MYDRFNTNNTGIFAFIVVLVFKLLSCKVWFIKKIASFTGKLLQNYKQLKCKIFITF